MINIILGIIKTLLGLKFGWIIAIVIGIIIGGSIIKNIITGSFSVAKLASGFNPFLGSVQGKLIYYGLIIFGCFCAYHFIMRPTQSYDTDYKNQIHHNQDVIIDQKVGSSCIPTSILWGIIQIGCDSKPITKTVNNDFGCEGCTPAKGVKK